MAESLLTERDGGVVYLTINRPDQRNALNSEVLSAIHQQLLDAKNDSSVRCIVIRGSGEKAFCSGMDLNEMVDSHDARALFVEVIREMYDLGKPIVAAVRGYALAGGMGLALACDVVIADETAVFGLPEINIGLWPFVVSVPLLNSIAPKAVLDLMMTGRRIDADEAARIGAITKLVKTADFQIEVAKYSTDLAAKPPATMARGRSAFYKLLRTTKTDEFDELLAELDTTLLSEEAKEGIHAFREGRSPDWNK